MDWRAKPSFPVCHPYLPLALNLDHVCRHATVKEYCWLSSQVSSIDLLKAQACTHELSSALLHQNFAGLAPAGAIRLMFGASLSLFCRIILSKKSALLGIML